MNTNPKAKLIRIYLPKDKAEVVAAWIKGTLQLEDYFFSHARGASTETRTFSSGVSQEKDVLNLVVHEADAEEAFVQLYDYLGLDKPEGIHAFMIQMPLENTHFLQGEKVELVEVD